MKWLILLAVLFSLLAVFLLNSAPIHHDPLHTPSPGNVALPFVLVVVLFIIGVGIAKYFRNSDRRAYGSCGFLSHRIPLC